ncbi:MAG: CvpA family protein [Bacteroidales bacterium]|nr:CvpA family protein [Bacteroidales bacterium]
MQTIDIILAICFVPAIIRGISKGFLEQAASLIALFLSVWMAFRFSSLAADWLRPRIEIQDTLLNVIAFVLVLVVVSIATVLLGKLLSKLVKVVMLGWLDKLLGVVFALLCTAVILGVLIVSFDTLNTKFQMVSPERLDSTVLYSSLRSISWFLFPYLKELIVS